MSWESDNAIFNVNGSGIEKLTKVLSCAMGGQFAGYRIHNTLGFILYSYKTGDRMIPFPSKINAVQAAQMIFDWMKSDEAKKIPCEGWDCNSDHDGSNEKGWRVYTQDWGHADGDWNCVIVKPAYLWYGK